MSSQKVVSTVEAINAVEKMKGIINGPLLQQVQDLNREGATLSDPAFWDGNKASTFRQVQWPNLSKALSDLQTELEMLRQNIDSITKNIMDAGN